MSKCTQYDLPFYPNQTYLTKNKAPECVPKLSFEMLARAQALGEKNGILPKDMSDWLLPIALTERRMDHGVNFITKQPTAQVFDDARKMGLLIKKPDFEEMPFHCDPSRRKKPIKASQQKACDYMAKEQLAMIPTNAPGLDLAMPLERAIPYSKGRAAVVALADKRRENSTPEMSVLRWNGQGKAAKNHLEKVKVAKDMLRLPENAELVNFYNRHLNTARRDFEIKPDEFNTRANK